jgi:hypothetical protein
VTRDLGKGSEFWWWDGLENDLIAMFFDKDLPAGEAKCLWQAHGLAAAVLEYLCGIDIYTIYLSRLLGQFQKGLFTRRNLKLSQPRWRRPAVTASRWCWSRNLPPR